MKVVGLVGEFGTGKSTIAAHLKARGAGHIDADRIAHEVLQHDAGVQEAIARRFGPEMMKDRTIDKRRIADIVFNDEQALKELNAIMHPPIIEACRRELDNYRDAGYDLVVIDAALLLEVPMPFDIDLTIALRCDRKEQIRRLREDRKISLDEIESRLESQDHIQKSFYKADAVVDTGRPKPVVLAEVDRLIEKLNG